MASSSQLTETTISMNTILHMITIKLSSSNYLLRKNQMVPILSFQNLLPHVDGTSSPPLTEILQETKPVPNPAYTTWLANDQKTVLILLASLSKEAVAEVLGLNTARLIWLALENAYSNTSIERIQNLRDQLRQTVKGTTTVSEFERKFKLICDQLAAVGQPVDESDKLHWFLCGLGASFETFSTAIRASKPPPIFRDLLAQAESHELFLKSLHGAASSTLAFNSQSSRQATVARGRGGS